MQATNTPTSGRQVEFFDPTLANGLAGRASPNPSTPMAAKLAAAGLVLASCGFGAAYAWQSGSHHSLTVAGIPALAVLAVLMALSLEIAKPFAIANAVAAFREARFGTGIMLALMGLIAVVYSLTAELSLMAMLRLDTIAVRQSAIATAADEAQAAQRSVERYDAAKIELASLARARAVGEVQAEIDGLLLTPGARGCSSIDGPITQRVCPKVALARVELARAQRRAG